MEETKAPLTEEQKMRRRAARDLGRALFRADFDTANPEATAQERKAAYKDVSRQQTKLGMRMMRRLEQSGFKLVPDPEALARMTEASAEATAA
ncbi:hypothetical protein [Pelagovum pacificum]|nr:hypothetical protein [Pelagovum pacificum]